MRKQIFIFVAILLSLSLVMGASYTFKHNEDVNFRFRCLDANNSYCASGTSLIISVEYPNGSNALNNRSMTHNPSFYNISLPTDSIGNYACIIISPNTNGTISEFTYDVTGTGERRDITKGILYISFLAILVFLFVVNMFGMGKLPKGNETDPYGRLLSINHLKHLRSILWVFAWIILLIIVFTSSNLALIYANDSMFGDVLFNLYRVMMAITLPMTIIWFAFIFIQIFRDREMKKMIERGIDVQGP
tara:strand:+ start:142 stop:882 length:741 start_codon:yes stop_codon:yes gene_type:complete